jgi:hypothetical protein
MTEQLRAISASFAILAGIALVSSAAAAGGAPSGRQYSMLDRRVSSAGRVRYWLESVGRARRLAGWYGSVTARR